jgi:hypothetical protein
MTGAEAVPNTLQIKKLQDERDQLLRDKRKWEVVRQDAAANEAATEARLKIVESALQGVDLGVGHARELADHAAAAATGKEV